MKSTGIVRKLDELGRVVLPIELRRSLDIEERDGLEVFVDDECIILRKYQPTCIFCGTAIDTAKFKDKSICRECIIQMNQFILNG